MSMTIRLILIYLFSSVDTLSLWTPSTSSCPDCLGKIHTIEDLELTKQPPILNPKQICQQVKYSFVIIVKSGSFSRRNFTRHTWAKEIIEHFNIPVLYAIGYPKDPALQKDILSENEQHQDLVEFSFLESYYNLTIKTTSVLRWYDRYCSNSSDYLLYVDDDVLIHIDKLIMYINQKTTEGTAIEGWFEKAGKIQRKGIGGVSKEDFPIDTVPDYLWGAAVLYPSKIISNDLLNTIFNASLPIFFRDDVFINGFIAEQAGIERKYMQGVRLYDRTEDDLKRQMIIIDFRSEDNRMKAWNCYKYHIQCNKTLFRLIWKILCVISLFIVMVFACAKCVQSTRFYHEVKAECDLCWQGIDFPWKRNITSVWSRHTNRSLSITGVRQNRLAVQWFINIGIMWKRVIFIFIFTLVLCYFLYDRSIT